MEAPSELRDAANNEEDIVITHREYEDEDIVTIDFGADVEASLDIVGETAIVVAGDRQFEFEIPDEVTEITTNDGMLTLKK